MSPSAAIENEIFLTYVRIAIAVLVLAACAIAGVRLLLKRDISAAWASYRSWLVMVPLVLLCIFLGRVVLVLFLTAVAIVAIKEFARATGLYRDWLMTGAVYLGVLVVAAVCLASDPHLGVPGWYGMFMALPVYAIAGIFMIPILRNRAEGQLRNIALAILAFIYMGWMFGHLMFLANSRYAYGYILFLVFAVELNDIAAFTCGRLCGHRKLRSNISPHKTLGGAIGAAVVSLALPWLLHFSFPHLNAWQCILAGLIVGIGGQLGDLSISVIKRDLGIKDMGTIIPGHGGMSDRIDSLIYVAPLFFHMVRYFHGFY